MADRLGSDFYAFIFNNFGEIYAFQASAARLQNREDNAGWKSLQRLQDREKLGGSGNRMGKNSVAAALGPAHSQSHKCCFELLGGLENDKYEGSPVA